MARKFQPLPDRSDEYSGEERRLQLNDRRIDGYGRRKPDYDAAEKVFEQPDPRRGSKKGRIGGRRDLTPERIKEVNRARVPLNDHRRSLNMTQAPIVLYRQQFTTEGVIDSLNVHIETLDNPVWLMVRGNTSPSVTYFELAQGDNRIPRIQVDRDERIKFEVGLSNEAGDVTSPDTTVVQDVWFSAEYIPG